MHALKYYPLNVREVRLEKKARRTIFNLPLNGPPAPQAWERARQELAEKMREIVVRATSGR
jgi:hypothetical protein